MAKVLIVDDSSFSRKATALIVKSLGYEPVTADSYEECVRAIDESSPDCILLDLLMPGIGGYDILKILQEKNIDIPVIVQTADIQESTRNICLGLGAAEVIGKPPKMDEISIALKSIVKSQP